MRKNWKIHALYLGAMAVWLSTAILVSTSFGAARFSRLYNVVFDTESPKLQAIGTMTWEAPDGTDKFTLTDTGQFKCVVCADGTQTFKVNSQDWTHTSGNKSAIQIKPNVSVGGTSGLTAVEISPRFASAIAGNELIGLKVDPVLKGTTGNLTGSVRAIETNLDFGVGSTRTISGDVVGLRMFLAADPGMTITGNKIPLLIAAPNSGQWTHMIEIESTNSTISNSASSATAGTKAGWLLIEVNGSDRYIRLYDSGV